MNKFGINCDKKKKDVQNDPKTKKMYVQKKKKKIQKGIDLHIHLIITHLYL